MIFLLVKTLFSIRLRSNICLIILFHLSTHFLSFSIIYTLHKNKIFFGSLNMFEVKRLRFLLNDGCCSTQINFEGNFAKRFEANSYIRKIEKAFPRENILFSV